MTTNTIHLPQRSLDRLDGAIQDMVREDAKPMRARDSRVYAASYGIIETFGLLLGVADPTDPEAVREAAVTAVLQPVEVQR